MIESAYIQQMATEMRGRVERHEMSEYLTYTTNRMRLLCEYSPLRQYLHESHILRPEHEAATRLGEKLGASLYKHIFSTLLEDPTEKGRLLLQDAITVTTRAESRRIKERGGADVNVLVIGTGVNGASFADRVRENAPHASILMLTNQSQRIGTFGRLNFQLNTSAQRVTEKGYHPEVGERGGPDDAEHGHHRDAAVAVSEVTNGFPRSEEVSLPDEQVEGILAAPAVLETQAMRIRKTTAAEQAAGHNKKYAVDTIDTATEEPITYYADVVVGAPGTGKERQLPGVEKLDDSARARVLASEVAENYLDGLTSEHCTPEEVYQHVLAGTSIVGGGDSGRIAAEKLLAKVRQYITELPEAKQLAALERLALEGRITWHGVHFKNREGYLNEVNGFEVGKRKYEEVSEYISSDPKELSRVIIPGLIITGFIKPVEGRVEGVIQQKGEDHPRLVVNGTASERTSSLIISAIGYDSTFITDLTKGDFPQGTEEAHRRINWFNVPVATRVQDEDIFFVGAVNKFKPTRREIRRHIVPGITMRTLIPRTEALANQIAHIVGHTGPDIPLLDRSLHQAKDEEDQAFQRTKQENQPREEVGIGLVRPSWDETDPFEQQELQALLEETEKGHRLYEREIYGEGVTDPHRLHWYSMDMSNVMERKYHVAMPVSRMSNLLRLADEAYQRYADGKEQDEVEPLTSWYARYIYTRLQTSDTAEHPIPRSFNVPTEEDVRMASLPFIYPEGGAPGY